MGRFTTSHFAILTYSSTESFAQVYRWPFYVTVM